MTEIDRYPLGRLRPHPREVFPVPTVFDHTQGELPKLNLPTDKPRPPIQTYNGASHKFQLSDQLTQQLKQLAQRTDATLYMILLAAFEVLLYRYTGQEDILVGSPMAGRLQSQFRGIVGYFANPVVLRGNLSNNPSFKEFLAQVRQTALQAFTHQDYPFALLVEKLQPHRDPSRSPIFQASFSLLRLQKSQELQNLLVNQTETDVEWGGLKIYPYEIPQQEGQFDLHLEMMEGTSSVVGSFKYNTDLFEGSTIERMAGHFQNLLSAIVENPQQVVGSLPLLSAGERHQLLTQWNDTASVYPQDKCIHQLFECQVEKTPLSVAVVFENQELTYRELNQKANQLAHHLQSLGVRPEVLVGICVERSLEMVVGLLGILKAGGAYVPLDPNYPRERLSYMLADAGVELLLTTSELQKDLPSLRAQVVGLDSDWQDISQLSRENLEVGVTSENLAYVIYTSGSTGQPKGTMILHSGMVNYLNWCTQAYNVAEGEGSVVNSSMGFDATITSFYSPLLVGRQVRLLPEDNEIEALKTALFSGIKFSLVKITPAHLEILSHLLEEESVSIKNQSFVIGGEALSDKHTAFWQQQAPQTRLINEYGPTETVVGCCIYEVGQTSFPSSNVPIGRPIANTQIYILDSQMEPVPIGVPGELHIGGDGLARGYLNRQELTGAKFIPNPFSNSPGLRLYKTGDLARYLPDGNIEYLGRIDNQVKIRGFRIELGEIEAVLSTHAHIQQAVVIATEEITGNKRLVAYVVVEQSLSTNQLREFLKQKLPEYMVPSVFVTLDSLPLTPNGKVDRLALPAPDGDLPRESEYVAPRTPTEEIIANIFAEVLGRQNVGIHDNFFALGGHSLLATQIISRLRESLKVEIPLREVFSSPTVAQLEPKIAQWSNRGLSLPPIQPRTDSEELPLSWAQERLWFLNQLEGKSATYNMPGVMGLTGELEIQVLEQALSEIIGRHSVLRTSFPTVDGTPIQVIHPPTPMKINVVDLQALEATERSRILHQQIQREASRPFHLEVAPLIKCSLWQIDSTEYVLLVNMHHIVSDGWSIGVLMEEISSLYQAFIAGEPSPLAELPIQYADFARWQREWLSGEVLASQLNYWKQELSGAPELLQLPTSRNRLRVQSYQGATKKQYLNRELTQGLQGLSRQSGTTLFMTLYGAFATLLYRYSGQADIVIGSPIANRHRSEIESLIGFFVNTLVLRTSFEEHQSFAELLRKVRETTLKAYEHQDVPFEQIVEALQPQRSLSHSPLFQVMFVLQNAPIGELELPGVTWSYLEQESTIAKFDLTLSMSETPEGLVGVWEYNTDLFEGPTIERMAGHFQNLLSAIVENPQQEVGSLPLLSAGERHQLLTQWNDTACVYPQDKCIHQLFECQVEKTPLSVAVVFENQELTYRELNQKANQLAHHLQSLGVGPEVLVGICVERSLEMVVGLLGILKAGGAYVPLDPNYPRERLSYMLADAGVEVLLTTRELQKDLPSLRAQVVGLDSDWQDISQQSRENLEVGVTSENLAYVIYTSGSTGQPKGVQIQHKALVNFLESMQQKPGLESNDILLSVTTLSFDIAGLELYLPLMTGARLVVLSREISTDGIQLAQSIENYQITAMQATPASWRLLLTAGWKGNQKLKILCGGESLDISVAEELLKTSKQVWNLYGPTETTIWSAVIQVDDNLKASSVPIGGAINNTQIYILDSQMEPVPIGVPGELHIAGDGLARGYLNRQELTGAKFIPNPFSNSPGLRLYKTGDLARYLPDGNIEYLGRIDNQVKIRGFRIELGEIEAVLSTHPLIQQAVVIATEEITGNKGLVAYVVVDESLSTNQLREFLKQKLPDYMVPSAFVTLDSLPLTPNGKVDRLALPAPNGDLPRESEYVAPRTPTEEIIANIFAEVLGRQNVGIHDNFFALGGHSLLAVRLMSQIQQQFQINLPLATLFQSPTVEQLALVIGYDSSTQLWSPLVPIQPKGSLPPLFCVGGAGGNVLYFHHLARYLGGSRPFYGLQAQGLDGETQPLGSIEEIASQYIKAIQTVQPVGPYFLAGHSFGGKVAFEMTQQLQRMGQSVAYVAILDTSAPIPEDHLRDDYSNWDNANWICTIAEIIEELIGENLLLSYEALASLTPEGQINDFKHQLERVGFFPPQTDIKIVRGILQVFRSQSQIDYVPQNTSPTPITLFRAREGNSELENSSQLFSEPAWGWNHFSNGEVEIHTVPGTHISMMREPHVQILAAKLQKSLEQAQTNQSEKFNDRTPQT